MIVVEKHLCRITPTSTCQQIPRLGLRRSTDNLEPHLFINNTNTNASLLLRSKVRLYSHHQKMSSSSNNSRTLKPALKLTPPSKHDHPTMHLQLPPSDLSALVTAAIKACPSPRRNSPEFRFCDTERNPVAPPPTPRMSSSPYNGPVSNGSRDQIDGVTGEMEDLMLTPASETSGRDSGESRRSSDSRRVRFE